MHLLVGWFAGMPLLPSKKWFAGVIWEIITVCSAMGVWNLENTCSLFVGLAREFGGNWWLIVRL
jgi:hypothetical protein